MVPLGFFVCERGAARGVMTSYHYKRITPGPRSLHLVLLLEIFSLNQDNDASAQIPIYRFLRPQLIGCSIGHARGSTVSSSRDDFTCCGLSSVIDIIADRNGLARDGNPLITGTPEFPSIFIIRNSWSRVLRSTDASFRLLRSFYRRFSIGFFYR